MIWIPIILNLLAVAPFLWTLIYPGKGPDGAMEASFTFMIAVGGSLLIWGSYGAIRLFLFLLTMWS